MQQLTEEGRRIVAEVAGRHGFSAEAVAHMLFAVWRGNASMAQFDHPEFAGPGQWMRGGMVMAGDMFDHVLKGRIDALCNELSGILSDRPGLLRQGSFQSQSQSGGAQQQGAGAVLTGGSSLFVADRDETWWPTELGSPSAVGSQNDVRYAYFADKRRLAVKIGNEVALHDTLDHRIGGFSQQQGVGSSVSFTSQHGTVNLASLPLVSRAGPAFAPVSAAVPAAGASAPSPAPAAAPVAGAPASMDILAAIERLGELKSKGILTEEEFSRKKAELLARL